MRQVMVVTGLIAIAVVFALFRIAFTRQFYRLPDFAAGILAVQRTPPRRVSIRSVGAAVLAGLDGALYAGGGTYLILAGLVLLSTTSGVGIWIATISLGTGLLCAAISALRIWQMWRALRFGEALVALVIQGRVGRVRLQGSPWGDLWWGRAASGDYQIPASGGTGRYYMQQRWALDLKPGTQIWVLRVTGRDVLYAPLSSSAG
jgi:hypothetical protein